MYNNILLHRNFAWILLIIFWLVVLLNVAEYRETRLKTQNVTCQNFMIEYCGIKSVMGKPFNICGRSGKGLSGDLLPLIIAIAILFHWLIWEIGKISSSFIMIQAFIIAKTNFTNSHYLISLIFYYAAASILFYIIFYKDKNKKTIYSE